MLHLNYSAWEARLGMEFQSFMFRNITTIGGTVAEVVKVIAEVFHRKDECSRRWWSRFEAEKCNFSEINIRIIFSLISEVSLFSFMGKKWNRMLNSFERGACA